MTPPPYEVAPLPGAGDAVWLDGLPGGPWPTVVERRTGDVATVAAPRVAGEPVRLPLGRPFTLAYSRREVPCEAPATLVADPADPAAAGGYLVRVTGEPRRIQRRQAVRVPVRVIARASPGGGGQAVGAVTENLSSTGALLRMAGPVAAGAEMLLALDCGKPAGRIEARARVVRSDRAEPGGARPWRIALAFVDLPAGEREALTRFLFLRQRELRRTAAERA